MESLDAHIVMQLRIFPNIDYEYFMLDADYTEEEFFEKFPTARTFPQIIVDGESIGGYQQYIAKLDDEN
jgi:glutaredoxin